MKKRLISAIISAVTAISAVSALNTSALYHWGATEEEAVTKKFGDCIKVEDFDWLKYSGNTGASDPIAVYMTYSEESSNAVIYQLSNMPDCLSFNVDADTDLEQIEAIVTSVDESLSFSVHSWVSEDNERFCFAKSGEITAETAKKVREALGEKAATFGYTSALIKYQAFYADYLTSYGYSADVGLEDVKTKLKNYMDSKGLDGEVIEATIGDMTPDGGIVNMPQTLFVPTEKLTAMEHLELAKDIYDETGMQPFMWHHESIANKDISLEIDLTDYLNGDANCDNSQSIADAAAILQAIGNPDKYSLSELGEFNADYDNNGITADDAICIQKKLAKGME